MPALQLRHNQITRPWKYAIAGFCCKRNIKRIKTKGNCAFPTAPVAYLSHFLHATSFLRRINHLHLFFMASLTSSQSVFLFSFASSDYFSSLASGVFSFLGRTIPPVVTPINPSYPTGCLPVLKPDIPFSMISINACFPRGYLPVFDVTYHLP